MSFKKIKSLATFYMLSNKQQKAIMLFFAGKYTQVQIAKEVQVSATTLSN
ncbi:hypothetical protein [Pediococcus ethanolidurans]|nr:hypothetical protein [Pediococcus ethanolidurans]